MKKDNNVSVEENKKDNIFSSVWKKTVDMGKKAAGGVQKGTKTLVEQTKKNLHDQKVKKYNPLFPENFNSEDFHLPNVIEIVDDAVRRGIDICEGAIGWLDRVNDVEVLHLYDEWVEQSGIQFIPVWKCDNVYCVDNFDRNRYINTNSVFGKATEEKLAELENIAYCLGAKSCSIEIVEANKEVDSQAVKIKAESKAGAGNKKSSVNGEITWKNNYSSTQRGKTVSNFVGHNEPKRPKLKWFAHDDNINGLIEKKCNDVQSVKSKILELSGACCATMTKKTACAIDKLLKISGNASMEQQAVREYSSTLVFEVKF